MQTIEDKRQKYESVKLAIQNDIQLNFLYKQMQVIHETAMPRIVVQWNGIVNCGYDKSTTDFLDKLQISINERLDSLCRAFDITAYELVGE